MAAMVLPIRPCAGWPWPNPSLTGRTAALNRTAGLVVVGGLLAGLLVAEPDFDDFTPYQPKGTLMSDADTRAWWTTSIIDMAPGHIAFRGENVEDLIGNLGFAEMIWFMVVGTKPQIHRITQLIIRLTKRIT